MPEEPISEDAAAAALDAAESDPRAGEGHRGGAPGQPGGGPGERGGGREGPGHGDPGAEAPERPTPHVCGGCGAVAGPEGEPLDNRCLCGPVGPTWEALERPELVSTVDPDTGYPNVYAQRVKKRLVADAAYLLNQARAGHAAAAEAVCEEFGHDARAGMCERCGARVGRGYE